MKTKEILDLIKFNKECYELTKHTEFIEDNKRLYRELKFNASFDKKKHLNSPVKSEKLSCYHFYGFNYESDEIEEERGQEHYKHIRELETN